MSYDIHIYAFESSALPIEVLAERVARDGWKLEGDPTSVANGFPSLLKISGNAKRLFGGEAEDASFEIGAFFDPQLDDVARENLTAITDELPAARRRHVNKCVALYELSFGTVPDALCFMRRLAFHIACSVGGVFEDPQGDDVLVLLKDASVPKWRREKPVEEIIGSMGVLVRDWATEHGYIIPKAFLQNRCERYVFLISSFDPPKVNGVTYWDERQLLLHLGNPPPGYVYRVFDFKKRVELARDGEGYKVVGPITGLPERPGRGRRSGG